MNADQIIQGIGKAVAATKPADEFCLFKIDSLFTCMTKAEWSGWMQAIFSVVAILAATWIATRQRRQTLSDECDKQILLIQASYHAVRDARNALENLRRKISGELKRPPESSYARIESIEHTLRILLAKEIPAEVVKPILSVLRETAYSKRAIEENYGKRFCYSEQRANKAAKRVQVLNACVQIIYLELSLRKFQRLGFFAKRLPFLKKKLSF